MRQLRNFLLDLETNTSPLIVWAAFFGTGYFWNTTFGIIEEQFARVTDGLVLLDTQVFFTAAPILEQVASYSEEARSLLWVFFILDNVIPQLVFFSYALLWVYLWKSSSNKLYTRLLNSYWMLFPLGVGFWDWVENIFLLQVVHLQAEAPAFVIPGAIVAHNLKILFVIPTSLATYLLIAFWVVMWVRKLFMGQRRRHAV